MSVCLPPILGGNFIFSALISCFRIRSSIFIPNDAKCYRSWVMNQETDGSIPSFPPKDEANLSTLLDFSASWPPVLKNGDNDNILLLPLWGLSGRVSVKCLAQRKSLISETHGWHLSFLCFMYPFCPNSDLSMIGYYRVYSAWCLAFNKHSTHSSGLSLISEWLLALAVGHLFRSSPW